jgi:hypothetical protein
VVICGSRGVENTDNLRQVCTGILLSHIYNIFNEYKYHIYEYIYIEVRIATMWPA